MPAHTSKELCSADGCYRPTYAKSLCAKHYKRFSKHKDLNFLGKRGRPKLQKHTCSKKGCDKPSVAHNLCSGHYKRLLRNRETDEPLMPRKKNSGVCSVSGCNSEQKMKGLCSSHYYRYRKYGNPNYIPTKVPKDFISKSGYVLFWEPKLKKQVYKHRNIVERMLGRKLTMKDVVVFKNGNRLDCRLENLYLMTRKEYHKLILAKK